MTDAWIGKVVGNCRIDSLLGEGGCGRVFRGVDLMLERPVAIKVLHPSVAAQLEGTERFRSEAHTLARLSHPNIATLYSLLREDASYLMVMEYVEGETFDALIRAGGKLSPDDALPLFFQALDGIHHAHAQGVVHRDIKASNLMRCVSGRVKVMDFGIARALGSRGLTQSGHPVGTPAYMSPEQVRGEETDPRSDIYSLGVLLFKMLTGRIPFQARSHYDVMRAHVEQVPPPLRDFAPSLPNSIENAVLRALAKSPEERFATAGEFRLQLEEAHRGSTATPPEPDPKPLDWALGSDGDTNPGSAAPMITTARPEEERDGSPKTGPTLPAYERATRVLADALSCSGAEGETSPATVPTFTQGSDDPVAGSPGEEGTPRTKRPRSFPWRGVAAGTLLLALALGLFWIQIRETRPTPAAALQTTPKPPLRVTPEPHGAVAQVPPQAHATPLLHDRVETPAGATDEAASTLELETSEPETEASSAVVSVVEEFEAKPSAPVLAEASAATGRSAVSPDPIATNRPPEGAPTPPAEPSRVEAAPKDAEESPPVGRGWIIRRE